MRKSLYHTGDLGQNFDRVEFNWVVLGIGGALFGGDLYVGETHVLELEKVAAGFMRGVRGVRCPRHGLLNAGPLGGSM
jgi:hypothetical protein